jgi:hypothetical protein
VAFAIDLNKQLGCAASRWQLQEPSELPIRFRLFNTKIISTSMKNTRENTDKNSEQKQENIQWGFGKPH